MASGQPNPRHTHVYMQLRIQGTCTHAYSCPKVQLVKVRGQGCRCSLELGSCPYILWDESIELRRISSPKGPECPAQSSSGAFLLHQSTGQGEPCCISEFTIHRLVYLGGGAGFLQTMPWSLLCWVFFLLWAPRGLCKKC